MSRQGAIVINDKAISIGSIKLVKNIERYYDVVEVIDIFISPFSKENIIKVNKKMEKTTKYVVRKIFIW